MAAEVNRLLGYGVVGGLDLSLKKWLRVATSGQEDRLFRFGYNLIPAQGRNPRTLNRCLGESDTPKWLN